MIDDEVFFNLIDAFRNLEKERKQEEIIKEIKNVTSVFIALCQKNNIEYPKISLKGLNESIEDYEKDEKFLNQNYAYIQLLKEVIGSYLDN